MKSNLLIKPRPSDYLQGINSPIPFKAVSNGDWSNHLWFNEDQRNPDFDDDGCACYATQKSLDVQMDLLLSTAPISIVNQLTTMGFMDATNSIDGKPHFHSSPRFFEIQTGNKFNGNSMPEVLDVLRLYGTLPWLDLPFTQAMTPQEYLTPLTPAQLAKAAQFLALVGGKNFCQYHWILNGGIKNVSQVSSALLQAPLSLGIAVDENGWNQPTPIDPPANQEVQHAVLGYNMVSPSIDISDNYPPYLKVLDADYPIPYILQSVFTLPIVTEQAIVSETAQVVSEIPAQPVAEQPPLIDEVKEILEKVESVIEA